MPRACPRSPIAWHWMPRACPLFVIAWTLACIRDSYLRGPSPIPMLSPTPVPGRRVEEDAGALRREKSTPSELLFAKGDEDFSLCEQTRHDEFFTREAR